MHLWETIMFSLSLDILRESKNINFSYKNAMMSMSALVHNFEEKKILTQNEINVRNNIAMYYSYIIWAKYISILKRIKFSVTFWELNI